MVLTDADLDDYLISLGNTKEFTELVNNVDLKFNCTIWARYPRIELFVQRVDAIKKFLKYLDPTTKIEFLRELEAVSLDYLDETVKIEFLEFKDYVSVLVDKETNRDKKPKQEQETVPYKYYEIDDGTIVRVTETTGEIKIVNQSGEIIDSDLLTENVEKVDNDSLIEDIHNIYIGLLEEDVEKENHNLAKKDKKFTGCCIIMHSLLLSTYGIHSEEYSRMLSLLSNLDIEEYCTILYYYGLDGKGRRSMEEVAKEMCTTLKKAKGRYNSGFRKIKNKYNERSFCSIPIELRWA